MKARDKWLDCAQTGPCDKRGKGKLRLAWAAMPLNDREKNALAQSDGGGAEAIGPVRRALIKTVPSVRHMANALASLQAEFQDLRSGGNPFVWHRPRSVLVAPSAISPEPPSRDDAALIARVEAAYQAACLTPIDADGGFWRDEFARLKETEHRALMDGRAAAMLRDPSNSWLFYGFDGLHLMPQGQPSLARGELALVTYDKLLRLGEAVGVLPMNYPEAPDRPPQIDVEGLLALLDKALGIRVDFSQSLSA